MAKKHFCDDSKRGWQACLAVKVMTTLIEDGKYTDKKTRRFLHCLPFIGQPDETSGWNGEIRVEKLHVQVRWVFCTRWQPCEAPARPSCETADSRHRAPLRPGQPMDLAEGLTCKATTPHLQSTRHAARDSQWCRSLQHRPQRQTCPHDPRNLHHGRPTPPRLLAPQVRH